MRLAGTQRLLGFVYSTRRDRWCVGSSLCRCSKPRCFVLAAGGRASHSVGMTIRLSLMYRLCPTPLLQSQVTTIRIKTSSDLHQYVWGLDVVFLGTYFITTCIWTPELVWHHSLFVIKILSCLHVVYIITLSGIDSLG